MTEPSPTGVAIAILVAAGVAYAFLWTASRSASRFGKVIVRLLPLALLLPILLYVMTLHRAPMQQGNREAAAPRAPAPQRIEPLPPPDTAAKPGAPAPSRTEQAAESAKPKPGERVGAEDTSPDARKKAKRSRTEEEAAQPEQPTESVKPEEPAPRPVETAKPSQPPAPPAAEARRPRVGAAPPAPSQPGSGGGGPPPGVPAQPQTDWDVVPVFYGTDRVQTHEAKRIAYTSERARRLELGRALITVPKTHQVPTIERPFAIRIPIINVTIYEQTEDPKQHFTIKELTALSPAEFLEMVRKRVAGSQAFKDQAVVFVHGYNTAFDYALFRTAQMAYDLKFDGASFLYSWPSGGGFTGYGYDRESSAQAEPYLREFLDLVIKNSGASSVSVIAHSMGNMPLLRVLQTLGPSLPPNVRLNQIILAAPDVDRDLFENLAANLKQYGRGVTLYCSANDRAMAAARRMAGGVARAGDVPSEGPIVMSGIDTIDVSQTSTDYLALNHSSYAERSALLNDIGLLLQTGERPPDRRIPILQKVATPSGEFWRYPQAR